MTVIKPQRGGVLPLKLVITLMRVIHIGRLIRQNLVQVMVVVRFGTLMYFMRVRVLASLLLPLLICRPSQSCVFSCSRLVALRRPRRLGKCPGRSFPRLLLIIIFILSRLTLFPVLVTVCPGTLIILTFNLRRRVVVVVNFMTVLRLKLRLTWRPFLVFSFSVIHLLVKRLVLFRELHLIPSIIWRRETVVGRPSRRGLVRAKVTIFRGMLLFKILNRHCLPRLSLSVTCRLKKSCVFLLSRLLLLRPWLFRVFSQCRRVTRLLLEIIVGQNRWILFLVLTGTRRGMFTISIP